MECAATQPNRQVPITADLEVQDWLVIETSMRKLEIKLVKGQVCFEN